MTDYTISQITENGITYDVCDYANGHREWFLNGENHREDGPAIEYANGDRVWRLNGKYHRVDGPAIESANGNRSWWLNDKKMSLLEWCHAVGKTDEEIAHLLFVCG